ncbi:MAG: hypothetical protein U5L09_13880 [Bacteroidales bacterium]|nr:hypothetical protein [Bacteroidales bacterium]
MKKGMIKWLQLFYTDIIMPDFLYHPCMLQESAIPFISEVFSIILPVYLLLRRLQGHPQHLAARQQELLITSSVRFMAFPPTIIFTCLS